MDGALVGAGSQWPAPRASEPGSLRSRSVASSCVHSLERHPATVKVKCGKRGNQPERNCAVRNRIGLDYYGQV